MKRYQNKEFLLNQWCSVILALFLTLPATVKADTVDLATVPLASATTTAVLPNLMFILDTSGSMDWDYTPDWVASDLCKNTDGDYDRSCDGAPPFKTSAYNSQYYNPEIYYKPPVYYNGTSWPSQTTWTSVKNDAYGVQSSSSTDLTTKFSDVEWCTGGWPYSDCLRNDHYLLPGTVNGKDYDTAHSVYATGTGEVATGDPTNPITSSRTFGPHYYTITPGEYCDTPNLTNCQFTQNSTFNFPARVRWCTSEANATAMEPAAGSCQAVRSGAYTRARYPGKFFKPAVAYSPPVAYVPGVVGVRPTGLISITGGRAENHNSAKINDDLSGQSIRVDGEGIEGGDIGIKNDTPEQVVNAIVNAVGQSGSYRAYRGGNSITPLCASQPDTVVCIVDFLDYTNGKPITVGSLTRRGTLNVPTTTATAGGVTPVAEVPAQPEILAQDAVYPGAFVRTDIIPSINSYPKSAARVDCAGATCTYAEEMTNFANWWTYYRTRMQGMKTAASLAFKPIDNRYRVGFINIHNGDYLPIDKFDGGAGNQKDEWYEELFEANPDGGTPLRASLATVGRIYAGQYSNDPVQYSCQQNFALLTTDGYWNGAAGVKINGWSSIGNQDGSNTPRPMYEGGTASSNSLADVAKYYYDTDLRTPELDNCTGSLSDGGGDVCENNVFVSGTDNNVKQHMTTFTLGLGVDGGLLYTSDYKTATSGDFYKLKNGLGDPTVNWPVPVSGSQSAVDDLWHAAVNGQGTYFSAKDPAQLTNGLESALASINAKVGAGAAAATSTLNPVAGDNFAYVASYTTVKWTGNLESRSINLDTGEVSEAATWCAEDIVAGTCASPGSIASEVVSGSTVYYCVTPNSDADSCSGILDGTSCKVEVPTSCSGTMSAKVDAVTDTRTIKMNASGALADFTYANITAVGLNANFETDFLEDNLSQWSSLTAAQKTAAAGANLVNFLRGQTGYEDRTSNTAENRLFRYREAVLGDALESTPIFIAKPQFNYTDPGYDDHKTDMASRTGTVYIGTNDGMLHAFRAADGVERWAYVPSMVIPNMWKLADKNYSTMHTNYVNGDAIVSDICVANCTNNDTASWKTILVAGLNGGGKGYYALDVTSPDAPSLLWELDTDDISDLGYTFGSPVFTKKADGTWVVLITSGYNNTTGSNPGKGFLYVINPMTGAVISTYGTGEGSASTPSGLNKISAYVDNPSKNNTAVYVYGGDLLGNVWRFDINSAASATNPLRFAELKDSDGNAQPITTRAEFAKIKNKRVIFIGTGKYLEKSDLTDTQEQTLYAIKDDDLSTTLVNPRTVLVEQTVSGDGSTRTGSDNAVDFTTGLGWYVDFPDPGERQNVPSQLVEGTLLVPTTVPSNTVCSPGGYSWLNFFNYKTGGVVTTTNTMVSTKYNAPIVGLNVIYIDGKPVVSAVTADNPTPQIPPTEPPFGSTSSDFQEHRVIWRELVP